MILRRLMLLTLFWLVVGCSPSTTPTQGSLEEPQSQESTTQLAPGSGESGATDSIATEQTVPEEKALSESGIQKATFGAGCYWCTEAVFQRINGVDEIVSGCMGGEVENPSYEAICSGTTGHAEVIQFTYDSAIISFEELLEVFWKTHDPTTLNQQGADRGTQYRSVVFYHNDFQKDLSTAYKKKLNDANAFGKPVVTEIAAASVFYAAKAGHQNYYNTNPNQGYCSYVIKPKVDKVKKVFADKLKQ